MDDMMAKLAYNIEKNVISNNENSSERVRFSTLLTRNIISTSFERKEIFNRHFSKMLKNA